MSRVVGVLSGKGGVGKTTVVANLGAALTKHFGKDVVILDTNVSTSHLGLHFGVYEDPQVTLRDVVKKNVSPANATFIHPESGVRIIPSTLSGAGLAIPPAKLKKINDQLKNDYHMVLMDCAPGLGKDVLSSIRGIDAGVIVTTPDFPAVADALKTIQLLEKMNKEVLGIIVNRHTGKNYELTVNEIESTTGHNVIGVVPHDHTVPKSISEGMPAVLHKPRSKSSVAFKHIAGRLVGEQYRPNGIIESIRSKLLSRGSQVRQSGASQVPYDPRPQSVDKL